MSKKVLVVEDEAVIGLDIASRLERNGYTVIGLAVDDDEVMEILSRETPDLMLMDISLKSAVDGIDLATQIHRNRKIPVVYITSYSDPATISRSMATSPYGYIIKPFTSQTLLATVSLSFTRIELEKTTMEKSALVQQVLENTSDGIAVVNEDYTLTMVNEKFCEITGMPSCDPGFNIRDILGGYTHSMGSSVICLENADEKKTAVMGVSRFQNGSIVTLTDITQTEIFKTELDIAEKKFASVFRKKSIPAVIASCDELVIKDCNDAMMKLYSLAAPNDGQSLASLVGDEVIDKIRQVAAEQTFFELPRVNQISRSGREFTADLRGDLISDGKSSFFIIDIEDVSEKVLLENVEKELKLRMIQTNKMAALGTLVSGVAHELNNPNNFIMFNSSIMKEYLDDFFGVLDELESDGAELMIGKTSYGEAKSDITQLLDGIYNGSERIRDIVLDLKSFARQDVNASHQLIHIDVPLRAAIHILSHKINKCTDLFTENIEQNLPLVMGNSQKLEQVFINIIMNALEATPGKHLPVTVRCFKQSGQVIVEVSDNGVGIKEEDIQRITEPFFTTKQAEGGTGLGLSIVYSIVQDHGGEFTVKSQKNQGTSVVISIPAGSSL
jgi:signal transduction histidine kinase/AmiR/NasT family two-component response regulator